MSEEIVAKLYNEYLKQRDSIIQQSCSHILGYDLYKSFSQKEKQVDEILRKLVMSENKANLQRHAQEFLTVRKDIEENSSLYKFIKKFPKGSDLHIHLEAAGDMRYVVEKFTYMDNCYMYCGKNNEKYFKGSFRFFKKGKQPKGWRLVNKLRQKSGDVKKFDQEIYESLTLQNRKLTGSNVDRWKVFLDCFNKFGALLSYLPVYKEYFMHVVDELVKDNIMYAEVRTILGTLYDLEKEYTAEEHMAVIRQLITEAKEKHKENLIGIKVIQAVVRTNSRNDIVKAMQNKLEFQDRYSDILVGFDLVGFEDGGGEIFSFVKDILAIQEKARENSSAFPLIMHGGETTREENTNLFDLVALGAKRIGHALPLSQYPILVGLCKQNNICIELCPISNLLLGLVEDLRSHPGITLLNSGVPVVLGSDDPGVFQYTGLSHEFYVAVTHWGIGLAGMKQLAINSIEHSRMTPVAKSNAKREWNKRYAKFINSVVLLEKVKKDKTLRSPKSELKQENDPQDMEHDEEQSYNSGLEDEEEVSDEVENNLT